MKTCRSRCEFKLATKTKNIHTSYHIHIYLFTYSSSTKKQRVGQVVCFVRHAFIVYRRRKQPIIMRIEDRLFDREWGVRSAMATRKCGNNYFRKYFMAVRKFTNIFVLLLILMVGSRDTLFLVCFTQKNVRTDRQWLLPNVNRQKMSPPIIHK